MTERDVNTVYGEGEAFFGPGIEAITADPPQVLPTAAGHH